MKNRRRMMLVTFVFAVIFSAAGLAGALSPFTNSTKSFNATSTINVEPAVDGCPGLGVSNITNVNVGLTVGEKVTVDWTFTPPPGVDGGCISLEGFEVQLSATRRSGRVADRTITASPTARSANAIFTETVDKIKVIKATVKAKFSGQATATKTENSDN